MKFTTWVAAIAIVLLTAEGLVFAFGVRSSCPYGERIGMPMPYFASIGGRSWYVELPKLERLADGDVTRPPNESPLVVCENHTVLGPAHASHKEITERGQGRFSHWGQHLIFSTSDNSDPNTNGRSYLVIRTDRP
jgi:hypothetical protein